MILISKWYGAFLIQLKEENGEKKIELQSSSLFPEEPTHLLHRHLKKEEGKVLEEEAKLVKDYFKKGGREEVFCLEERLTKIEGVTLLPKKNQQKEIALLFEMTYPPEYFSFSQNIYKELLSEYAKKKVESGCTLHSKKIILLLSIRNELIKTTNYVKEHFFDYLSSYLDRTFSKREYKLDLATLIEEKEDKELKELRDAVKRDPHLFHLCQLVSTLSSHIKEIEKELEKKSEELMPNTSFLVGPLISAKLVALAGGLKRLAHLPSSTIQTLGAEKSLFKHLKDNTPPPKHGAIFQHPALRKVGRKERGKVARIIASKIAIAVKMDYFSGEFKGRELKDKLEKRLRELREKNKKE
ncbi:MAG TPA: hypothetical protein EYP29_02285 [Thermoplasmata archaeon]|nr:hypothetical protein [Thermoplasmata archaeon]